MRHSFGYYKQSKELEAAFEDGELTYEEYKEALSVIEDADAEYQIDNYEDYRRKYR